MHYRTIWMTAMLLALGLPGQGAVSMTDQEFKARVTEATKGFRDLVFTATVSYKNKKALAKIDPAYAQLYDFSSAQISYKHPDKLRMDGKLGMVRFEYIVNGGLKLFRAPSVRISKKEDYSDDPAKTQDALDIGLVTPSLWKVRRIEIIDDAEAAAAGEVKLRLHWPKGNMALFAWVDATDMFLKRFEKRDAENRLQVRVVYSEPRRFAGVIWLPTKVDICGPDGEKAGTSEVSDVKVNTSLPDSLFE
jgi:outer membrane lipoprotein-sorting protein